ncbi:MAG TPA: aminodeoxychorismate lyase [Usitatibacter sp.]|nr:aminodeoxychorismate lyase [Usitatibacter sp.]
MTLVDGKPADCVAVADRGLAFGDGVFRTILVRGGRPLNWLWHRMRLAADGATLGLPLPDEALLLREIGQVAPGDAVVKVTVTRGASLRGYAIPAQAHPTRIVAAFPPPAYPPSHAQEGVAVRRCALVLSAQPRLAGAKTLNRLENVLARSEWQDGAIAEGLLADEQGRVIEGTMSNLFLVREGRLATPRLDRCGVVGAQRERIRELAGAAGIACEECELRWQDVLSADEAFLTNSLIGIWPVARFEDRTWAPGPLTRRLQALLAHDDAHP